MARLTEFDALVGFNINKQKLKIVMKNMKIQGKAELMNKRFKN